jgi:hypothetical protein
MRANGFLARFNNIPLFYPRNESHALGAGYSEAGKGLLLVKTSAKRGKGRITNVQGAMQAEILLFCFGAVFA